MKRLFIACCALVFMTGWAIPARAGDSMDLQQEVQTMKEAWREAATRYEERIQSLERKVEELTGKLQGMEEEKELEKEIGEVLAEPPAPAPTPVPSVPTASSKFMDASFSSLFTAGTSTAPEGEIANLQGGSHDPKKRGFTVQNLEMSLAGAVDPYLNGEAHLVYQIDEEGESKLEVEEAFLTTQTLPGNLQLKAGTFFTEFGRLNSQHPHTWSFVDQPIINSRLFGGDGLRGPGARLSWLTPLRGYSELQIGVQNANGETAYSFLSSEEEEGFSGHPLTGREVRSLNDALFTARWLHSQDFNDEATLNVGLSALQGPNASGPNAKTNVLGLDLYYKRKPARGWPFTAVQAEIMKRNYEADEFVDDLGAVVPRKNLDDWGCYLQFLRGYKPGWVAGLRYEFADGDGVGAADPLRDERRRFSANVTRFPSEFSKIRLQYNLDRAEHLANSEHSIWLQYEFLMGSHGAHKF